MGFVGSGASWEKATGALRSKFALALKAKNKKQKAKKPMLEVDLKIGDFKEGGPLRSLDRLP